MDERPVSLRNMKRSAYRHELKKFISEGRDHYKCRFAEAAFEMGELYRKGIDGCSDDVKAYYYYLQSEYAVMLRFKARHKSEDEAFLTKIKLILTQMRRKLCYGSERLYTSVHPFVLYQALEEGHDLMISLRRMKSGRIKVIGARIPKSGHNECPRSRMLITYDRFHYCELRDFVITYAQDVQDIWYSENEECIRVDSISMFLDEQNGNRTEFYYRGRLVAFICARDYVVSSGRPRYVRF